MLSTILYYIALGICAILALLGMDSTETESHIYFIINAPYVEECEDGEEPAPPILIHEGEEDGGTHIQPAHLRQNEEDYNPQVQVTHGIVI